MQLLVLQILPSVCIRAILQSPAKSSATVINLKPAPTTPCSVPVQMSAQWQTFAAPIVTIQAALIAPRSVKRLPATPLRISFLQSLSLDVAIFLKHIYLFRLNALYLWYNFPCKRDISAGFSTYVNTHCVIIMI